MNEEKVIKVRKPFAVWTVAGKDYRLKLTTSSIITLEQKYKCNLLTLLNGSHGQIMPLTQMLNIIQGGLLAYEHGVKITKVHAMYTRYVEDGGTQLGLLDEVLLPLYEVSGFFPETQEESLEDLEESQAVQTPEGTEDLFG